MSSEEQDLALIQQIKKGNKNALALLIERHYAYIYNVALKFFNSVHDAEDAAQEVMIKVITNIGSYKPEKGKLRTWLYRIVFNHYLNAKKSRPEILLVEGFHTFFDIIDGIPFKELSDQEEQEMKALVEEARISCMAGMLMCLSREQRLTYIIGEVFDIDHNLAAEIFEITADNFRKRLSRARRELYNWMNNKCGLVNKENPCRCPKKTRGFIEKGFVNPKNLKWNSNFSKRIHELSEERMGDVLDDSDTIYRKLYRDHPFKHTKDKGQEILQEILNNKRFSGIFNLNN